MRSAMSYTLLVILALAASTVQAHSVAWCFGLDGQQNDILAIGSYHRSTESGWNSASTVITTSGTETWAPSMTVVNYILEPVSGTESSYFGCGYTCVYCSGYDASDIFTWQIKQFTPNTFTQGSTYGIAQSSTQQVDEPYCAIPGGGATFPVLPPLGVQAISCPGDQATATSPTYPSCTTAVSYPALSCSTACPGSTCFEQLISGQSSGSGFSSGTTTVIHELYVDGQATGDTCSFDVVVPDNEPPQIVSCPSDQSFCGPAPHQFFWTAPTFADCSAYGLTNTHNSGDSFGPGTTVVTTTATDSTGNATPCSFSVSLFSGPPTLSCPGDFTVDETNATPSTPGSPPTYYTANYGVSALDGCGAPIAFSQMEGVAGPPAAIPYTAFPQQFTYVTAPDPVNGMTDTCSFEVSLSAAATYAQISWVGQPSDQYLFGNGTANPSARLYMYIDVRLCWEGPVAPGDTASFVIHDGTSVIHTFVTKDYGHVQFGLDSANQCKTFLGPHGVNIGDFYLGLSGTSTVIGNNWIPFELSASEFSF